MDGEFWRTFENERDSYIFRLTISFNRSDKHVRKSGWCSSRQLQDSLFSNHLLRSYLMDLRMNSLLVERSVMTPLLWYVLFSNQRRKKRKHIIVDLCSYCHFLLVFCSEFLRHRCDVKQRQADLTIDFPPFFLKDNTQKNGMRRKDSFFILFYFSFLRCLLLIKSIKTNSYVI